MRRVFMVAGALLLIAAGCDEESANTVSSASSKLAVDASSDGSSIGESGATDEADTAAGSGDEDTADEPDNDDAGEIVGNPDLDLDELGEIAPDVAEALDDIDDIVSIGDCQSEFVGLAMSYVPDGWQCRVLDQPTAGMDGFTLFNPGDSADLEITIGTPSPVGQPCELLQMCDSAVAVDLSENFEMTSFELGGVPFISGTHNEVEAEVVVTTFAALTSDQNAFVTMVLDGVVQIS